MKITCRKAARSLIGSSPALHWSLVHAWPCTPPIQPLTHWCGFSTCSKISLFTSNLMVIRALTWVWLSCPSNSLPVSRKALRRLPGFFLITGPWLWAAEAVTRFSSPLHPFSRLPLLSLPSRIQINYIWRYLRCFLMCPLQIINKDIKRTRLLYWLSELPVSGNHRG